MNSAKEIYDAAHAGKLSNIPPETIVKWIRTALDAEDIAGKVTFIKELILQSSMKIQIEQPHFTPSELAPYFRLLTNGSTVGIIAAALLELSEEGRVAAVDPGRAPTYKFC